MPDAPPSSTDEAAVEAARRIADVQNAWTDQVTHDKYVRRIVRIITDAYAEQREAWHECQNARKILSSELIDQTHRLTAERKVREELVEALQRAKLVLLLGTWKERKMIDCDPPEMWLEDAHEADELIVAALAAAEKLEEA